jgi:4-amino-4-deoxy-L-arabinose transferase-like glycosyltransferase
VTPARVVVIAATAGLTLYGVLLFRSNSFVAGGADSSGYLNEARLMASGRAFEEIPALSRLGLSWNRPDVFIPLGYGLAATAGTMAPSYPPGLPLHMALLGIVGGWKAAPFLAAPLASIAAILLVFAVARELGLPPALAAAGSAMLAVCPVLGMAIQPMSDVPATAWVLAAIFFGLRARRRVNWAVGAGAALGVAVLVRPTNVLAAIPLLLALPPRRGAVVRAIIGGLPAAAMLAVWNVAAFGRATSTGYGAILTWTMSPSNVLPEIRHYAFWLPALLTPLVPLGWIASGFDRRIPPRDRVLLFAWFGAFFAFYCFYEVYEDWWSVRFLLPGIPAMILAALLLARDMSLPARPKRILAAILLAAVAVVGVLHARRFHLLDMARGELVYRDASHGAARYLPERSLVAAMQMSGGLKYYADRPILRWDRVAPHRFGELRRLAGERGVELYALLWPFEVVESATHLPGDWQPVARFGPVVLYRLD